MIQSSDISVIVQGSICRQATEAGNCRPSTQQVTDSVRKHLPHAHLILSTWKGEDVDGLDYDELVLSDDPGSLGDRAVISYANILRQIISTRSGLAKANRRYALKIRSDTEITSAVFLSDWYSYASRGIRPAIFKSRILVSAIFTPQPVSCPSPYFVSDFFSFGFTHDLIKLWDASHQIIRNGFDDDMERIKFPKFKITRCVNAEQRLILAMLSSNGINERLVSFTSISPFQLFRSEKFIASHFLPCDPESSGIKLPERFKAYRNHHTYRHDHRKALFRAENPVKSHIALYTRIPAILFASIKGIMGILRRNLKSD
jgi:hypothetical protein